ncbi:MFS transporter, UMF1 family [Promicromonospora umidemergens]|uniref:MFS transporter n=1 Tax=Promicromonospora umidemergens TaxID=629679 RepID=A0ABP8XNV8_9MICO|nr:MFS transporter [Promicromonospora umidemergens]MCP2281849.1 MFS transporter, UMF1 family [Promicromonospora umidemergens]
MTDAPHRPDTPDSGSTSAPPPPTTGLELQDGARIPRRQIFSWALWDWGTQPFNTVILTFVFTALYLTTESFLDPDVAALGEGSQAYQSGLAELTSGLGFWNALAGVLIFLLAPVLGQRADATGRRKAWLAGATAGMVLCMLSLWFVEADPAYFVLGAAMIGLGSVLSEIAGVNYNAMMVSVATPRTVGKVSGLGWGLGYVGGILMLVLVVVANSADWWGMPTDNGLAFRVIAVVCAIWALAFAWPIFAFVPELPPTKDRPKVGFFAGYVVLFRDIQALWRTSRRTFWFLAASAVYRDGLSGVFAFGAIIGSVSFGFSADQVIIFGIAANLVAGVSTVLVGLADDRFGPRSVILSALSIIVVAGLAVVVLRDLGPIVYWVGGLTLSACVGPAQAASRSYLARVTPAGKESEIFGLYATTGRATSWLSSTLWTIAIVATGATIWGTLGIVTVVLVGLVLLWFVRDAPVADA